MTFEVASRFVSICGTQITMTPSTLSSAKTPCSASWYRVSSASPIRSIGLFRLTVGGRCACRIDFVFGSRCGQFQAVAHRGIGRHDPGAAGIGHDGDAPAPRQRLIGERDSEPEQFLERLDAKHAALGEKRIIDFIRTGQRARVRSRRFCALRRPPGLDGEDRLFLRNPLRQV